MKCTLVLPIADRELLAYLAGEGRPDTTAHLAACPACRQRARDLQANEAKLRQMLYRADCPDAQMVSDFRQGYLVGAERHDLVAHLARCPHCTAELARLDAFLADIGLAPTASPLAAARVLVARLVAWGADAAGTLAEALTPAPAYVGVRGESQAPRVYEVEGVQIILDIQDDLAHPGRRRIQGIVVHAGSGSETHWREVYLSGEGEGQAQASVDDLGDFAFGGLVPGVYTLRVVGSWLEIWVKDVALT